MLALPRGFHPGSGVGLGFTPAPGASLGQHVIRPAVSGVAETSDPDPLYPICITYPSYPGTLVLSGLTGSVNAQVDTGSTIWSLAYSNCSAARWSAYGPYATHFIGRRVVESSRVGDFYTYYGLRYRCIQAGQSGGVEPNWNTTPGSDTTDGSVVWRATWAADAWASFQQGDPGPYWNNFYWQPSQWGSRLQVTRVGGTGPALFTLQINILYGTDDAKGYVFATSLAAEAAAGADIMNTLVYSPSTYGADSRPRYNGKIYMTAVGSVSVPGGGTITLTFTLPSLIFFTPLVRSPIALPDDRRLDAWFV